MNARAAAYVKQHETLINIDGELERMLPLDKVQGFLDLLGPDDVSADRLQALYWAQSELVRTTQQHSGATSRNED